MELFSRMITLTLQLSVPLVLGAMCGTIAERGGIILLGVEGLMLLGAFTGVLGSHLSGNAYVGLLFSIVGGGIFGYLYTLFCLKLKAHQSVVGVGVNMFASGITAVLLKVFWNREGMSDPVASIPNVTVPVISEIPVIGMLFKDQSPYLYLMILIVATVWVVFYRTKVGLRYRAIGEQPFAVQTSGINVNKYRYVAMVFAGVVAGVGGSFLSLSQNNLFVMDMTAGRGFMGLAANIFGGWNPIGSFLAGMVFAVAQTIRFYASDIKIPIQFIQMMPYLLTLFILLFVGKKAKGPEALGKLVK
ncbi:ABC transporter permease [Youngiibacter fragilis]|uniref:Ribose ABC transporter permease n=1 Tax=Youngiibacter fragilis 232.1 TaxID=994573 RepID=V7I825_9CLOT|nr:ABC transporter permease [Youngiibacter fragilis]ETA81431.1 ribose ABC transporter permease [Youngiibacter fragilis 232.1]